MTFDPFKQARLMNGFQNLKPVSTTERETDIDDLKRLAGIKEETASFGGQMSRNASELAKIQRERNIRPGDPEWFKLWFALPKLTGEQPYNK